MRYKSSFYNICTRGKKGYVVYNTLYNTLVRMDEGEYSAFCFKEEASSEFAHQLVSLGLWVEEHIDEKERYISLAGIIRSMNSHPYSVTIATTMQCNARCSYCYETGVTQLPMSLQTESKLIEFLSQLDTGSGIHITWFGGEPLMNPGLIDRVSTALTQKEIRFSSYLISNGSLINSDIIDRMNNLWNTKDVQITLDGIGDVYDRKKNYVSGEKYFVKILDTISELCERGIFVHIRLNISRDNIEDSIELAEFLEKRFSQYNNLCYYPAFLTGVHDNLSDRERSEIVSRMLEKNTTASKLTISRRLHSIPKIRPCMYTDPFSFSVDINGIIHNCEHNLGHSDRAIGTIDNFEAGLQKHEFMLEEECKSCVYLPKCMGGCTSERNSGEYGCMVDKYLIQAYLRSISF